MKKAALAPVLVAVTILAVAVIAEAQPHVKMRKIGWIISGSWEAAGADSFKRELRQLGYIEGKNITIEDRSADNDLDRLPALVEELVRDSHLFVKIVSSPPIIFSQSTRYSRSLLCMAKSQGESPYGFDASRLDQSFFGSVVPRSSAGVAFWITAFAGISLHIIRVRLISLHKRIKP
jgi:hypothetical protein